MSPKKKPKLSRIQSKIQKLIRDLNDSDPVVRLMGINELVLLARDYSEFKNQVIDLLKPLIGDPDADVRDTAVDSIQLLQIDNDKEIISESGVDLIEESDLDNELERIIEGAAETFSESSIKQELTEDFRKKYSEVLEAVSKRKLSNEQLSGVVDKILEKTIDAVMLKRSEKDKAHINDLEQRKLSSSMNFNPNLDRSAIICLLNIPFLITLLLTIFVRRWEVIFLSWAAFLLIIGGVVQAYFNKKNEFYCFFCDNKNCKNRGGSNIMFYCNQWILKPKLLGKWYLFAYFTGSLTVILSLINITLLWLPLITLGGILGLKLIFSNKTDLIVYEKPPNHPNSCAKCDGTGKCLKCKGTGITKIIIMHRMRIYSIKFKTCEDCKGLRLCPKEIEAVIGKPEVDFPIAGVPGWAICLWIIVATITINLYIIFY